MATVRFIAGLVVLIFLVTFALQNMEPQVTLHYYFGYHYGPIPFFLSLLGSAIFGIIVALAFSVFEQLRLRAIIRRQKRQIVSLKLELDEYQQLSPEHLIEKNLTPATTPSEKERR